MAAHLYIGSFVHSLELGQLEHVVDGAIAVDASGVITNVARDQAEVASLRSQFSADNTTELPSSSFMCPGLIDTHAHAPQFAQLGLGTDLPLLEWLDTYTFPTESKFSDGDFAQRVYGAVVDRFLRNGTTSCVYFASLHLEASKILATIVKERGQHGLIGKVCMDRNSPDFYREADAQASLRDTTEFVRYVKEEICSELVVPIVTPRFAISCSHELMKGLGDLAEKHNLPIQSHISENKSEISFTSELHPEDSCYAETYQSRGLLTKHTIMAHGVHLSDAEMDMFVKAGAGVSHCPTSNFTLFSGVAPVRKLLQRGVRLGLGTDVSGGYAPSVWAAMRDAIAASASAHFVEAGVQPLTYGEAFHLATQGGAQLLRMEDRLGSFHAGKWFSALLVDTAAHPGPMNCFGGETLQQLFQKAFYTLDDRNITSVYVKGNKIQFQ